jgi:hypothetical protein
VSRPFGPPNPGGVAHRGKVRLPAMSTKKPKSSGAATHVRGIPARGAGEAAQKAIRDADRAEAEASSLSVEGYGCPARPIADRPMPQ